MLVQKNIRLQGWLGQILDTGNIPFPRNAGWFSFSFFNMPQDGAPLNGF